MISFWKFGPPYLGKTSYSSRKSSATLPHIPRVAGGGDGRDVIQVQVTVLIEFFWIFFLFTYFPFREIRAFLPG